MKGMSILYSLVLPCKWGGRTARAFFYKQWRVRLTLASRRHLSKNATDLSSCLAPWRRLHEQTNSPIGMEKDVYYISCTLIGGDKPEVR